ncbi:MAG: hypothetical protein MHM6MM_001795 [Cercozoa sp. M6MM]
MSQANNESFLYRAKPFMFGGLAGCAATCIIQPIDMVKVQIQMMGTSDGSASPFRVASHQIRTEGVGSLYRGLSAALLRQATYTTARLGLFRTFSDMLSDSDGSITFGRRAVASLAAGGLGSIVGVPADLSLVRMQADNKLPPAERRGYKHVGDALTQIVRQEGLRGMFTGTGPTIVRAMSLNFGMLATYDQAKESLAPITGDGTKTTALSASVLSGFFASFFSLPFDFIKTRIQQQKADANGRLPYKGVVDCFTKVAKQEGPLVFYRGFPTFFVRIAPHAVFTLLIKEFLFSHFGR